MAKELGILAVMVVILTVAIGSAVGLAMVSYTGTVYTNLGVATETLNEAHEAYTTGNNTAQFVNGTAWAAQNWTASSTLHTITAVKLLVNRTGTPGTVFVNITGITVATGKPNATEYTSGSFDGDAVTDSATAGEWVTVSLPEYTLVPSATYGIVVHADVGEKGKELHWCVDTTASAYTGGVFMISVNGGTAWTGTATTDALFEFWGNQVYDTAAGSAYSSTTNIIYTSWPLIGLAVLGLIGAAVLASLMVFR